MATPINPNLVEIVKVTELPDLSMALDNFFAHCGSDGVLGKVDTQSIIDFIAPFIASIGASAYIPTTGTSLSNPVDKESAFTFVGAGTFTQTTGGDVVTTELLNILSWNGTTWMLSSGIEIPIDAYTKTEVDVFLDDIKNVENTELDIINPNDKSSTVFVDYANIASMWGFESTIISGSNQLKTLYLKTPVGGNITVMFVTGRETGTTTIVHSKTISVSSGVNTIPVIDLTLPVGFYDTYANKVIRIAIRNTVASTGLQFKTAPSGSFPIWFSPAAGGVVSSSLTLDLSYWIVTEGEYKLFDIVNSVESVGKRQANNYAELIQALSISDEVVLGQGTFIFPNTVNVPQGKTIRGLGKNTIIQAGSGVLKVFSIDNVRDVTLSDFTLVGNGANIVISSTSLIPDASSISSKPGKGTGYGIWMNYANGAIIKNINVRNFDASGIYVTHVGAEPDFDDGVDIINCNIRHCYQGIEMDTRAEYSKISNVTARLCAIGISIVSGNVTVGQSSFTGNRVGAFVGAGANNSHGVFSGCFLNHTALRALQVNGITNGHDFIGCHFFDGIVEIVNSIGTNISNGIFDGGIIISSADAVKVSAKITNNFFNNNATAPTIVGTPVYDMKLNRFLNGNSSSTINN